MNPKSIFKIDHPSTDPWAKAIGQLIVNFGAIEIISLGWIDNLSTDQIVHDMASDMPLSRRIQLITHLIDRSKAPRKTKNQAKAKWKEISEVSQIRNSVAHNPIVFGWNSEDESGIPDFLAIPNMKSVAKHPDSPKLVDSLGDLNTAVNKVTTIALELENLLDEFLESD